MGLSQRLAPLALSFAISATSIAQAQDNGIKTTPPAPEPTNVSTVLKDQFHCEMPVPKPQTSEGVIDRHVVATVLPATVWIQQRVEMEMPFGMKSETGVTPLQSGQQLSSGSGIIVDPSGIIVTNAHVASNEDEDQKIAFTVTLYDPETKDNLGMEYNARLVGIDNPQRIDVAVLQIEGLATGQTLPCVKFADPSSLSVSQTVFALGNPFGLNNTYTEGNISNLNRQRGINNPFTSFYQTDAAINPGNSGGGLFDEYGKVIGLNTAIYSSTKTSAGLGFVLPAKSLTDVVNKLIKNDGIMRRGWIGIGGSDLTQEIARQQNLPTYKGAVIDTVTPDGPADKGGLKEGDVVIYTDGEKIIDLLDFSRAIKKVWPGDETHVTVLRDGKVVELNFKVGDSEAPEAKKVANGQDGSSKKNNGGIIKPDEQYIPKDDAPQDQAPAPDQGGPTPDQNTAPPAAPDVTPNAQPLPKGKGQITPPQSRDPQDIPKIPQSFVPEHHPH